MTDALIVCCPFYLENITSPDNRFALTTESHRNNSYGCLSFGTYDEMELLRSRILLLKPTIEEDDPVYGLPTIRRAMDIFRGPSHTILENYSLRRHIILGYTYMRDEGVNAKEIPSEP